VRLILLEQSIVEEFEGTMEGPAVADHNLKPAEG
jgi:hypothetical protein